MDGALGVDQKVAGQHVTPMSFERPLVWVKPDRIGDRLSLKVVFDLRRGDRCTTRGLYDKGRYYSGWSRVEDARHDQDSSRDQADQRQHNHRPAADGC